MSIPDFFTPAEHTLVVTDKMPGMFSDVEQALVSTAAHCAHAKGGFRRALRMVRRLLVQEMLVLGPANSRAIQYLIDKAEHAGINIRRQSSYATPAVA